jgi:KaiC/GvpD/RAD55 family RecA-like ATPase
MERVKSGIPGLDDLIEGGFPKNSVILLTGTCGTGKTIMGIQFLWYGAQNGENGVFISFEEPIEQIKANAKAFGWDLDKMEKEGKIIFVRYDPFHVEDIIDLIEINVRKNNAKRVVIDSISALNMYIRDLPEIRRTIFNLVTILYKLGCTTLMISEMLSNQQELSRFGVEEFLADGVVVLYYRKVDAQFARALTVWKMRGTNHSQKLHPYAITENGIVVYSREESALRGRELAIVGV